MGTRDTARSPTGGLDLVHQWKVTTRPLQVPTKGTIAGGNPRNGPKKPFRVQRMDLVAIPGHSCLGLHRVTRPAPSSYLHPAEGSPQIRNRCPPPTPGGPNPEAPLQAA